MTQWLKPVLLSALICPVGQAYADRCDGILSGTRLEKQKIFTEKRDALIKSFHINKNARIIIDVIKNSTASGIKNAIWLKDISREVVRHAEHLNLTQKRAREVAIELGAEVKTLEEIAICYHFSQLESYSYKRLMMLKLYEDVNVSTEGEEAATAFGYFTSTGDGNSKPVIHLTYSTDCKEGSCYFKDIAKSDFKGTGVRLIHHPEAIKAITTKLTTISDGKPVKTYLNTLELKKTGEIFTSPEIYAAIYYYGEDVDVDKKSFDRRMMVDIPWALKKGVNTGWTYLLDWRESSSAHVVIMEDDKDFPFSFLQSIMKIVFKAAVNKLSAEVPVLDFASTLNGIVNSKDTKNNGELVGILEGWQKDDFIDELVLEKGFDSSRKQNGINGNAVLGLGNMYMVKENDSVAGSSNEKSSNGEL